MAYKNILLCLMIGFLLIGSITALEFDNIKQYDEESKTITVKNSLLGISWLSYGEVAEIKLISPLKVKVGLGYQQVAELEIKGFTDYSKAFKEMEFYNIKSNMQETTIEFDWRMREFYEVEIDDYKEECNKDKPLVNGTIPCKIIKDGSHIEQRKRWVKINPADIKENEVLRLGIFTDVKQGDKIEWIPNLFGVRINEWASWTADLNTDLRSYYNYEIDLRDSLNINNLTNVSSVNATGIIGSGREMNGLVGGMKFPSSELPLAFYQGAYTINIWTKFDTLDATNYLYHAKTGATAMLATSSTRMRVFNWDGSTETNIYTGDNLTTGQWYMMTITRQENGTLILYVDSSNVDRVNQNDCIAGSDEMRLGYADSEATVIDGVLDEIGFWNRTLTQTEVTQLWNNGNGITYFSTSDGSPTVNLNSPIDNYNSTNPVITFNGTAYDDFNLTNVSLYIDGALNETNSSGINNSNYIFTKTLADGSHTWTYQACDNASQCTNVTRSLTIDSELPIINIYSPNGTIDYHLLNTNLTLNYSVTDTNLDSCWYELAGINYTLNCSTNSSFNFTNINWDNLTIWANDTLGNVNSVMTSWTIKLLEISQTYNSETTEGSLETFLASVNLGSGYSINTLTINYNGILNSGQNFADGDNRTLTKTNLLISNVNADTNVSFYWTLLLSDSTSINLTTNNQTIYNLNLDNCSSNTKEIFNFTAVDEEAQTILPNATIEIAVNIYSEDKTTLILNHSAIYEKVNPLRICLNRNLTNDSNYLIDVVVRYENEGHAIEYYNIVNASLTNSSTSQKITLYDLNATDSTDFQLTFTGSDFLPTENALIYVDRQYISENTFKTVELPKTDYNGQAVLHLVRNDVIYNIRIIKNGIVLGNFENLVAFCDDFTIGDCNIELNAFDSVENIFNFDSNLGIIYTSPEYNATANTITFEFVTSDGTTKTVRLEVSKKDIFGNRSLCNDSLISSGGTLTCNIDPNLDESVLKTKVYVDEILAVSGQVSLDSTNYGSAGYLIMFVMTISFILMFSGSKTGVLISMGLTLAGSLGLGLVSGDLIGVGASGLWLLLIIFIGIYKLNKDKDS